jgi:hypothetical protein
MYMNQIIHQHSSEPLICNVLKSQNHLEIGRIDYINDKQRKQLILIMDSNQSLGREVNVILKGCNLILEATCEQDYDMPFRTHLIERKVVVDYENEDPDIGFSEIKLNPGYNYNVLSSQVINPGSIKVVLQYRYLKKNKNN